MWNYPPPPPISISHWKSLFSTVVAAETTDFLQKQVENYLFSTFHKLKLQVVAINLKLIATTCYCSMWNQVTIISTWPCNIT